MMIRNSDPGSDRAAMLMLATVVLGAFMSLLDTTIVNVALPSIQRGLDAGDGALEWTVSGYALAFGLILIPAGRLGDSIGRRPLYIAGLAVFLAASLGAGLAANPGELVTARIVQGLGAGTYYTQINALILDAFAGAQRARAFGVLAATIGLSTAIGPLAGGLLITAAGAHTGWRWIFFVNLAIGAIAVPAAIRLLPAPVRQASRDTDGVAVALLTLGLMLILFALIEGRALGWPPWSYACLGAATPVLIALARWERSVQARGRRPLIPPAVVAHGGFARGAIFAMLYFASFTSIFFTLAVVWQEGLGHSALASGLLVTPFAIGTILTARGSARIAARLGHGVLVIGCLLVAAGLTGVVAVFHYTREPTAWALIAPLLVTGLGHGLVVAPNINLVLASVPRADSGAASGVLNTAQRVGASLGIALVGTVLFGTLRISSASSESRMIAFSHSLQWATLVNIALILASLGLALTRAAITLKQPLGVEPLTPPTTSPVRN